MSYPGPDDPTTRPLPQGSEPSPYASPHAGSPAQPYGTATQPYGAPVPSYTAARTGAGRSDRGRSAADRPTEQWLLGPATQAFDTSAPPGASGPRLPQPAPPRRRGRGWRSPKVVVPAALGVLVALVAGGSVAWVKLRGTQMEEAPKAAPSATGKAAALPPGRTWLSGAWTGGQLTTQRVDGFGAWRGQPADVVTTYPAYDSWDQLKQSDWNVGILDGYKGRISYGLPLIAGDASTLEEVAAGQHDDAFQAVAEVLNKHGRQDAFVRIGLEANGTWYKWGVGADRVEAFKAAWRHVQSVMKAVSPKLTFVFDIGCGTGLNGGSDRLDSLTKLYPGDDVVDVVGCDHYDQYGFKARNQSEWDNVLRPKDAVGLTDVAEFARAHKKQMAIPEWGLADPQREGGGDNPYFIYSMYSFFLQNKDVLAYENYFNEQADSLGSGIWDPDQNPKAAEEYRKLWGQPANLGAASASPAAS